MNPSKKFEIIATSDIGPEIIEIDNSLFVKFIFDTKYPNPMKILFNYIQKITKKICYCKSKIGLFLDNNLMDDSKITMIQDINNINFYNTFSKAIQKKIQNSKDLEFLDKIPMNNVGGCKHSGLTCSKSNPANGRPCANNAIQRAVQWHNFVLPHSKKSNFALHSLLFGGGGKNRNNPFALLAKKNKIEKSVKRLYPSCRPSLNNSIDGNRKLNSSYTNYYNEKLAGDEQDEKMDNFYYENPNESVQHVRGSLHPDMSVNTNMKNDTWVPG